MERDDFGYNIAAVFEEFIEDIVEKNVMLKIKKHLEELDVTKIINDSESLGRIVNLVSDMESRSAIISNRLRDSGALETRIRLLEGEIHNLKTEILTKLK